MRSRVASRRDSSSPKNSVKATRKPVTAAKNRKIAAGKPIQRCHLRQNLTFMVYSRCGLKKNGITSPAGQAYSTRGETHFQFHQEAPPCTHPSRICATREPRLCSPPL